MKVTIECLNGAMDGEKKEFVDKEVITIGRGSPDLPPRDFPLERQLDRYISRDHADIILENGKYFILDDHSANGTFLNDEPVPRKKKVELPNECILKLAYIKDFHEGTNLKIKIDGSGKIESPEKRVEEVMKIFEGDILEAKKRLNSEQWKKLCKEVMILIQEIKGVKSREELIKILNGMAYTINAYKSPGAAEEEKGVKPVDIIPPGMSHEDFDILKNRIFSSDVFNEIKKETEKCK